MGDHRISIKIEFEMHDHKAKHECWLNWSDSVPAGISDWIWAQHSKAMDNWFEAENIEEERKAATRENAEREQLAALKAKYETPSSS